MQQRIADYTLTTDTPPDHYEFSYEQNLYHRGEYLTCQLELPKYSFWLCDIQNAQIHGVVHFHLSGPRAVSQNYAPFGWFDGIKFSNSIQEQLISFIVETLARHGLNEIELKLPAPFYYRDTSWTDVLSKLKFSEQSSINHHIVINDYSFKNRIHLMEQRKLFKCQQFTFRLEPLDQLQKIYYFIEACRRERDQGLSMKYGSIEKVVRKLPEEFLLCTVSSGSIMAAAAIVIKVTSRCWYQFYPAHSKAFNKQSPLVFLMSGLYELARNQGIDIIDLGTSEVDGVPIEGLLKFKSRIAGVATAKSNYIKVLHG